MPDILTTAQIAAIGSLSTSTILIVIAWMLWRRLNAMTDLVIAIARERPATIYAQQLPPPTPPAVPPAPLDHLDSDTLPNK